MVLWLFIGPLLQPLLRDPWALPPVLGRPAVHLTPGVLCAALWCATFGLVAAVLLMNTIAAIRYFSDRALTPERVHSLIEDDLSNRTHAFLIAALGIRGSNRREEPESWFQDRLRTAAEFPVQEQHTYFRLMLAPYEYDRLRSSHLTRFGHLAAPPRPHPPTGWWQFRRAFRTLRYRRRTRQASRLLHDLNKFRDAREVALLSGLRQVTPMTNVLQLLIVQTVLRDARDADRECARFAPSPSLESTPMSEFVQIAANELYMRPHRQDPSERHPGASALEPSLWVPRRPYLTYRHLVASLLQPGDRHASRTSFEELGEVLDSAKMLSQSSARDDALRVLCFAVVRKTVLFPHPGEPLPPDTLADLVAAEPCDPDAVSPVQHAAEQAAFRGLANARPIPEESRQALLRVLPRTYLLAAFYLQLVRYQPSNGSSRDEMGTAQTYQDAWISLQEEAGNAPFVDVAELQQLVNRAMPAYPAPDGELAWLVESLTKPFNTKLCAEFFRQQQTRPYSVLAVTGFVQWHLVLGTAPSTAESSDVEAFTAVEPGMVPAAATVRTRLNSWARIRPEWAPALKSMSTVWYSAQVAARTSKDPFPVRPEDSAREPAADTPSPSASGERTHGQEL